MKRSIVFTICFLLTSISFASVNKTVLPLSFGSGFKKPNVSLAIPVKIGKKTIPLIFDMGASSNFIISADALKGIKFHDTGKKSRGVSPLGVFVDKQIRLPLIKIGDFTLHNVEGEMTTKKWAGEKYWKFKNFKIPALKNGVIGLSIWKRFNVLVDFKGHRVTLYKKGVYPNVDFTKWIKIPFQTKYDFIGTNSIIDGIKVRLTWDTAHIPSQIKPFAALKSKSHSCSKEFNLMADNLKCFKSTNFITSNKKLPNTTFLFKDLGLPKFVPIDGFVGTNYFFKNEVFFDFKNNVMYIHHYKNMVKLSQETNFLTFSKINEAHKLSLGYGTKVAVLDWCFDMSKKASAKYVDQISLVPNNPLGELKLWHGSWMVNIIHRIAPKTKIMPIRVRPKTKTDNFQKNTEELQKYIVKGIIYAADHGAVAVTNSTGPVKNSLALNNAIKYAEKKGCIFVDVHPEYTSWLNGRSIYANKNELSKLIIHTGAFPSPKYPAKPDPKRNIYTWGYEINPVFKDGYGYSNAPPIVGGVIALMKSANQNLTPEQIRNIIYTTAMDIDGFQVLNAEAAVKMSKEID